MILPITEKCNQNCLFCSAKGKKEQTGKRFFSTYFENCEGIWQDYLKFFGDKEFQPLYEKTKRKN